MAHFVLVYRGICLQLICEGKARDTTNLMITLMNMIVSSKGVTGKTSVYYWQALFFLDIGPYSHLGLGDLPIIVAHKPLSFVAERGKEFMRASVSCRGEG